MVAPASAIAVQMMFDRDIDRTLVGAGHIEEDILCLCRHPGPLAVDDGRERADMILLIGDQGKEREVFYDLCIVPSLRVLGKDAIEREFFGEIERNKLRAPGEAV